MGMFKRAAVAAALFVLSGALWVDTPATIHAQVAAQPNSQPNPYRLVAAFCSIAHMSSATHRPCSRRVASRVA
jgi:hypothetical protein